MKIDGAKIEAFLREQGVAYSRLEDLIWLIPYTDTINLNLSLHIKENYVKMYGVVTNIPENFEIPSKLYKNLLFYQFDVMKLARYSLYKNKIIIVMEVLIKDLEGIKDNLVILGKAIEENIPFVNKLLYDDDFDPINEQISSTKSESKASAKKVHTRKIPAEKITPGKKTKTVKRKGRTIEKVESKPSTKKRSKVFPGRDKIKKFAEILSREIKGQNKGIEIIIDSLVSLKYGIKRKECGAVCILVAGTKGCGKSEVAKQLAGLIYKDDSYFFKIDSAEPNFIGQIIEFFAGKKMGLILLEEGEKMEPENIQNFIEILKRDLIETEDIKINLSDSIFIITSVVKTQHQIGFLAESAEDKMSEDDLIELLQESGFSESLMNYVDKFIYFRQLNRKDIIEIIKMELKKFKTKLKKSGVDFQYDKHIIDFLSQKIDLYHGANSARRILMKYIYNKILLGDKSEKIDSIKISLKKGSGENVTRKYNKSSKVLKIIITEK